MKKFLIIGDIHGRSEWAEIANDALTKFKHIIFVGDYVDSFNIRPSLIKHNLEAIIEFKIQNTDNVTLLLGNHDWVYIYDERCSGFQLQMWPEYKKIFLDNIDLFDMAYGYENWKTKKYTLVTHAGLTNGYYNRYINPMLQDHQSALYKLTEGKELPIHVILNYLKGNSIMWKVGSMRGGYDQPSPLWADYLELIEDAYPGINQIFGHTASGTATTFQNGDDILIKVDGHYNYKLSYMEVSL